MEPQAPAANAWPVHCTARPERSAAAFCTVCKLSFAGLFLAVRPDGRWSPWLATGTLPAGATLAVVAVLALEWLATRRLAPAAGPGRQ